MAAARKMDIDITRWILEFLLRQPIPEVLVNKILTNIHVPLADDNPRLKKTVILRSIQAEIGNGSVSETILELLEIVEELDQKVGIKIMESMKAAYCAVAVECAVKYLGGSSHKPGQGKYFEAVKEIWRRRIDKLERVKKSELVSDQLRECRDEIEASLWDSNARKRLLNRNTRNDALRLVRDYLKEAMATMGPPFLELVARIEMERKEKQQKEGNGKVGDTAANECNAAPESAVGDEVVNGDSRVCADAEQGTSRSPDVSPELEVVDRPPNKGKELQKNNAICKGKQVAGHRRHKGSVRVSDSEGLDIDIASGECNTLPTPEVNKVQEALKSSSMELRAVVKDPLPDALHLAETLMAEMARKLLSRDASVENPNEKGVDVSNPTVRSVVSEMARNFLNLEPLLEKRKGKDDGASNPSVSQTVAPVHTMEGNAGIPSCSHQNDVPKPSLMERNSTARTYEWDDSIDGSPEGTTNHVNRVQLDSPKRKAVSPLRRYEITKFARRRKMKRWSLEEEDALREGVQKFGKGNWKLILNSNRKIFEERTEVDLKDKWRNMTRY